MRRALLVLALALGTLVLTPGPSWACSCASRTTEQQVRDAVTVAAATVDWTATDGQELTYKVDVDLVYKGAAATTEKLLTHANEASCGLTGLAAGNRYLFFIDGEHPGKMRVNLCGGTVAYDDAVAQQVVAVTGPASEPSAGPGEQPSGGGGDDRAAALTIAGLSLLALVSAAVLLVSRRGRWA